ncbi:hypothetical protein ACJJIL_08265 [Microbulbifer sp. EKSA005]|uniref:hypothetical protein n=1 Tax=Microbulbifer sp. EKSA005 TaxID=3243364 RepID=UPI004042A677
MISERENTIIAAAFEYWIEKWGSECPTLFGFEKETLESINAAWPQSISECSYECALAINSSFGEILYGASALNVTKFHSILGFERNEIEVLFKALRSELERKIG